MDNNILSKIWVGKTTTNIHLLQFKNSRSLTKNTDFESRYIRTHTAEKQCKISNITFTIFAIFLLKYFNKNCHPEYFRVYFSWWNRQTCLKVIHSNTKNAKSKDRQSQASYLRTPHFSALNNIFIEKYFWNACRLFWYCYWYWYCSSGAKLSQKNTLAQNIHLRFHTMTSKKIVRVILV